MSSPVGTLLSARYRLDALVGTGGMSTVYRAFDQLLERQVAIKLMHREIADDDDHLERFRREARAVAQLNHHHIVGVIDAGEDEGRPYIVFEYVEGETLKECIRRQGRLPIAEAVAYAIEIARALGAAHQAMIVHRDVKPQNVLIDEEGTAKVTDFGIARSLLQEGLTADGRVLGTTDYVSPEQALGRNVTGQSDLYSLGIVLYEMLTGEVPFHGSSQVSVAMKHVQEDLPDIRRKRPEVSSALAAVIDGATDKELDRRYADDAALIADLEEVLAVEAGRTGQITGEATRVFKTLPGRTRRRVPSAVLHRGRILTVLAVVTVAAVAAALLLALDVGDRTERGTAQRPAVRPPAGLATVSLAQSAARAYDPKGTDGEHDDEAKFAVDDDTSTTWSTETYEGATLNKEGVGLYIDAKPSAAGRKLEIRTTTPGWDGAVYAAATSTVPKDLPADGWAKIGTIENAKATVDVPFDEGAPDRARFYLIWITKLPPGDSSVELSEVVLLQMAPR